MGKLILNTDAIEALRSTHGEIAAIETPMGTAVFRAPTAEVYARAIAMQSNETQAVHAARFLAVECVVHPDRIVFQEWIAKRPGIPKAADGPLSRLAGIDESATAVDSEDGETTTVATCLGPAKFRVPDESQFNKYRRMAGAKDPQAALSWLALACAVEPTREILAQWLERKPGIAGSVAPHIHRIAGVEETERLKG